MGHTYRIFQGNKRLNPMGAFPLLVIVARESEANLASWHFIFTGLETPSFLLHRSRYQCGRGELAEFKEFLGLDAVLDLELQAAAAHLQTEVFKADTNLNRQIFWEGYKFDYESVPDAAFANLVLRRKNKTNIEKMLDTVTGDALAPLERIYTLLSRVVVEEA
jgi:hypothetical protein